MALQKPARWSRLWRSSRLERGRARKRTRMWERAGGSRNARSEGLLGLRTACKDKAIAAGPPQRNWAIFNSGFGPRPNRTGGGIEAKVLRLHRSSAAPVSRHTVPIHEHTSQSPLVSAPGFLEIIAFIAKDDLIKPSTRPFNVRAVPQGRAMTIVHRVLRPIGRFQGRGRHLVAPFGESSMVPGMTGKGLSYPWPCESALPTKMFHLHFLGASHPGGLLAGHLYHRLYVSSAG